MLRARYRIIVQSEWQHGEPADALIALHARRSADSVARFHDRAGAGRVAVVLTGTDLYKDLPESREAARSLDCADRIVVLQEDAPRLLSAAWRKKCDVIFQSARALRRRAKARGRLDCVVVGHLRAEKDPATLFAAIRLLPEGMAISIRHIGAALDPALGREARALQAEDPRYRYAGALPRGLARAAMASAHVLIHPSIVEGGANVVVEAITGGTPVIASRISGNVGMLGPGYPGYFDARDESGLAARLVQMANDPESLRTLEAAAASRKPLFAPAAEARAIRRLAEILLV
jgi:putative glycosyltransferase (TIGR04348 family)